MAESVRVNYSAIEKDRDGYRRMAIQTSTGVGAIAVWVEERERLASSELHTVIHLNGMYDSAYIPALIAALQRAQEIAAAWAAESDGDDDRP